MLSTLPAFGAKDAWITPPLVISLLALGFTTGFLHYWLDRAVYRLSRPAVRNAARGLLQGVRGRASSI